MTLRTSCFDRGIFLKTVKRFWPLWVAYLGIWLLDLPIALYENYSFTQQLPLSRVQRFILGSLSNDCLVLVFLFAPLAAMAVFSHLYNDRSCGTYASLPVKRESMFLSVMLAGLVPMLLTHVITFGALCASASALGHPALSTCLTWLCGSVLELLFFYGFAVLCAQLTGHILIMPAVYVVLSFTAPVIWLILGGMFELFLYGYNGSDGIVVNMLSPVTYLASHVDYVLQDPSFSVANGFYILEGWGALCIYAAVGLAMLVGSLSLYKHRRMETAGDVVSVRALRPVFKYTLATGCSLVLGIILASLFYSDVRLPGIRVAAGIGLCCLIGGFIGYFGADMLNRKTFRVFGRKKTWLGFGCFALVLILGIAALELDITGYETRTPDPEKIQSVNISFSGENILFEQENVQAALELHKKVIATRKADLSSGWEGSRSVTVNYFMENGTMIHRRYSIPLCADTRPLLREAEDLLNSPAARASKAFSPAGLSAYWFQYGSVSAGNTQISLDQSEAYQFYTQCILPDLLEGKLDRSWLLEDSIYRETTYNATIRMEIQEPSAGGKDDVLYKNLYLTPTTESHRINDWLTAHNIPLVLEEDEEMMKYGYSELPAVTAEVARIY